MQYTSSLEPIGVTIEIHRRMASRPPLRRFAFHDMPMFGRFGEGGIEKRFGVFVAAEVL